MFPGVISRDDAPHVILIRVGADMVIAFSPWSRMVPSGRISMAVPLESCVTRDGAALRELDQAIVLFEDDIFGVSRVPERAHLPRACAGRNQALARRHRADWASLPAWMMPPRR